MAGVIDNRRFEKSNFGDGCTSGRCGACNDDNVDVLMCEVFVCRAAPPNVAERLGKPGGRSAPMSPPPPPPSLLLLLVVDEVVNDRRVDCVIGVASPPPMRPCFAAIAAAIDECRSKPMALPSLSTPPPSPPPPSALNEFAFDDTLSFLAYS
jgi:hypothetical protein